MKLKLGDWTRFELNKRPTDRQIEQLRLRLRRERKHEGVEVALTRSDHNPKGIEVYCHFLVLSPKERAKLQVKRTK